VPAPGVRKRGRSVRQAARRQACSDPKPGPVGNTIQGVVVPTATAATGWCRPQHAGTGVGTGTVENTSSEFDVMRTHCQQSIGKCRTAIAKGDWATAKQPSIRPPQLRREGPAEALGPLAGELEKRAGQNWQPPRSCTTRRSTSTRLSVWANLADLHRAAGGHGRT